MTTHSHTENKQMTGTVKRIISDKGFGFIADMNGKEYFFHKSGLAGMKFEELFEGDKVDFEPDINNHKGPRAANVRFAGV